MYCVPIEQTVLNEDKRREQFIQNGKSAHLCFTYMYVHNNMNVHVEWNESKLFVFIFWIIINKFLYKI